MVNAEVVAHGRDAPNDVLDNKHYVDGNPYQACIGQDEQGNPVFKPDLIILDNEKILKNTGGIEERRRVAPNETVLDLLERTFYNTGFPAEKLDGLVVATLTHDNALTFPSVACRVQEWLDARNVTLAEDLLAPPESSFDQAVNYAKARANETGRPCLVVGLDDLTIVPTYRKIDFDLFAKTERTVIVEPGSTVKDLDRGRYSADGLGSILVVNTSDRSGRSAAEELKQRIGATNATYVIDVAAACSGFTHGVDLGKVVCCLEGKNVFVAGGETLTRIVDPKDVNADLFGDGAGGVVLGPTEDRMKGILATDFGSEVFPPEKGSAPGIDLIYRDKLGLLRMPGGPTVKKRAVKGMIDSAHALIEKTGLCKEDVSLYIPHQFNGDGLDVVEKKIDTRTGVVYRNIAKYANMSTATVPFAFSQAINEKRIKPGEIAILVDIGSGLARGGTLIRL